jgi:flagellum-specific peptidoglycan hydrolase FlgJ
MTRAEYIQKFEGVVIDATKGTGLFPSLMMAQAILESSDKLGVPGNSTLARVFNNHFGIKAEKGYKGKSVNLKTREVFDHNDTMIKDYFRVYDTPEQSFYDRVKFLQRNHNYKDAGVFTATAPELQAHALKEAGYATDPDYAVILAAMIKTLNLKRLDSPIQD